MKLAISTVSKIAVDGPIYGEISIGFPFDSSPEIEIEAGATSDNKWLGLREGGKNREERGETKEEQEETKKGA